MKTIRVFAIVAFFCAGIQLSNAQDVHVFLAAEHVRTFTEPYLSPSGGTLGLRFPVNRVAVEFAFSHAWFGSHSHPVDTDHRTVGTATFLYGFGLTENWWLETGVSAGYGNHSIYRWDEPQLVAHRAMIPVGAAISVRNVREQWVQPFLTIQPTYHHMLNDTVPLGRSAPSEGIWAMVIRAGVSFALPNEKEPGW